MLCFFLMLFLFVSAEGAFVDTLISSDQVSQNGSDTLSVPLSVDEEETEHDVVSVSQNVDFTKEQFIIDVIVGMATVLMLILTVLQVRSQRRESKQQWEHTAQQLCEMKGVNSSLKESADRQLATIDAIHEIAEQINRKMYLERVKLRFGEIPLQIQTDAQTMYSILIADISSFLQGSIYNDNFDFRIAIERTRKNLKELGTTVEEYIQDSDEKKAFLQLNSESLEKAEDIISGRNGLVKIKECADWINGFRKSLDDLGFGINRLISKL